MLNPDSPPHISPPMPEPVARFFSRDVRSVTGRIFRDWKAVYAYDDLHQMAWEIAFVRWHGWSDQHAYARADLNLALRSKVRAERYSEGWSQSGNGKARRWNSAPSVTWPPEWVDGRHGKRTDVRHKASGIFADDDGGVIQVTTYDEDHERSYGRRLPPGVNEHWARMFRKLYPEVAAEFDAAYEQPKPKTQSWAEYERRRETRRARLCVKHAAAIADVNSRMSGDNK